MDSSKGQSNFFKMGAVVATGELWDMGLLGRDENALGEVRRFLSSFGIRNSTDLQEIGMGTTYLHDFEGVLADVGDK